MDIHTDAKTCLVSVALPGQKPLIRLYQTHPKRYPQFYSSSAQNAETGRWDILFAADGEPIRIFADDFARHDFLCELDAQWRAQRIPRTPGIPVFPFRGGWSVYLGYEIAGQIEPRLALMLGDDLPVAHMQRCPAAIVFDHLQRKTFAIAERGREDLLRQLVDDYHAVVVDATTPSFAAEPAIIEEDPGLFLQGVHRSRDYITAGDVFQVNLSRAWRTDEPLDATSLFSNLMRANPAPFSALFDTGSGVIVSSSPERLIEVRGRHVATLPIAGTRPRATGQADRAFAEELLAHPKERAEHVMLVDLERNDLGRVCRVGTVKVDALMQLESYAHVHHIVSRISGDLRDDITPGQVLRAVFPGGTITGCPKVRCMEIIAELEIAPRQAYTGSVGYLNRDGDMDFNILIRTMHTTRNGWVWRTGAGIVYDSIPEQELQETRAKARGLLLALKKGGE